MKPRLRLCADGRWAYRTAAFTPWRRELSANYAGFYATAYDAWRAALFPEHRKEFEWSWTEVVR